MHLRKLEITNIRSISRATLEFRSGEEPGWHVILGPNGAGKSAIIRSFALACMGEKESYATRQDFNSWIRKGEDEARIGAQFSHDGRFDVLAGGGQPPQKPINVSVDLERGDDFFETNATLIFSGERHSRTIWGGAPGWFSASFGPFRRFTGGDRIYDRIFLSNRRLAPHLTALGEDVALTEAMAWLTSLHVERLQSRNEEGVSDADSIIEFVTAFFNDSNFLPHNSKISHISKDNVYIEDGDGALVPLDQLSDGYRSALSLAIELIRQMFELFTDDVVLASLNKETNTITIPGVVAIDEIDAHLHPTWQQRIGAWLIRHFPSIQFIVTTHSPIICRAVSSQDGKVTGSVWKLPTPGTDQSFRRIVGDELEQLVFGDIEDAYGTDLFGSEVGISAQGEAKFVRLAELNRKAHQEGLSRAEAQERRQLRRIFAIEPAV